MVSFCGMICSTRAKCAFLSDYDFSIARRIWIGSLVSDPAFREVSLSCSLGFAKGNVLAMAIV